MSAGDRRFLAGKQVARERVVTSCGGLYLLARAHKPTIARHKWRGVFGDELSATRLQWAIEEVRRAG